MAAELLFSPAPPAALGDAARLSSARLNARRIPGPRLTLLPLLLSFLAVLVACSPIDVPRDSQQDPTMGLAPVSPVPTPRVVEAPNSEDEPIVEQVIQKANDEQARAITEGDPSVMRDTSGDDYYQQLLETNQGLLAHSVKKIHLMQLEWGSISVSGATATATSYETWATVFADGTSQVARDENDYTLNRDRGSWKIQSDVHPGDGSGGKSSAGPPRVTPQPVPPDPDVPGSDSSVSHNWAGYAASGDAFTRVHATWTVPRYAADGPAGTDAAWVGIGGVTNRDLIQAGTQQTTSGTGSTEYHAWVETLPQPARQVPLVVLPGDSVSVTVEEETPSQWLISFVNNATGETYEDRETYRSSHSSAEWIEEAPSSLRGGVLPLDDFGSVEFSEATAVRRGVPKNVKESGAEAITLEGRTGQALAVASAIGADGQSFTVNRTSNSAATPVPASPGTRRRGAGQGT